MPRRQRKQEQEKIRGNKNFTTAFTEKLQKAVHCSSSYMLRSNATVALKTYDSLGFSLYKQGPIQSHRQETCLWSSPARRIPLSLPHPVKNIGSLAEFMHLAGLSTPVHHGAKTLANAGYTRETSATLARCSE